MIKSMKTPLKRVRGLGSGHSGTHQWYGLRITSIALIPLCLWFVFGFLPSITADHQSWIEALRNTGSALGLILILGFSFYHGQSGFQVVVEDYVPGENSKRILLLGIKGLALGLFGWGVLLILRLHLLNY